MGTGTGVTGVGCGTRAGAGDAGEGLDCIGLIWGSGKASVAEAGLTSLSRIAVAVEGGTHWSAPGKNGLMTSSGSGADWAAAMWEAVELEAATPVIGGRA